MRWFFLLLASISFLFGACIGQASNCTYSYDCMDGVASDPTFQNNGCTYFKWGATMKGQDDLRNDTVGPNTAVRYSQELQLLDNSFPDQNIIADSTEHGSTFTCDNPSSCTGTHHQVTITTNTNTGVCPCFSNSYYITHYIVGTNWDLGYEYQTYLSEFVQSPPPRM